MLNLTSVLNAAKNMVAPKSHTPATAPTQTPAVAFSRDTFTAGNRQATSPLAQALSSLGNFVKQANASLNKLAIEGAGTRDYMRQNAITSQANQLRSDLDLVRQFMAIGQSVGTNPAATAKDRAAVTGLIQQVAQGGSITSNNRALTSAEDVARNVGRTPASDRGLYQATQTLTSQISDTQSTLRALSQEGAQGTSGERLAQIQMIMLPLQQALSNQQALKAAADQLADDKTASPARLNQMKAILAEAGAGTGPARLAELVAQASAVANQTPAPLANALEGLARRLGGVDTAIATLADEVQGGARGERLQQIQIQMQDLLRDRSTLEGIQAQGARIAREGGDVDAATRLIARTANGMPSRSLVEIAAQLHAL